MVNAVPTQERKIPAPLVTKKIVIWYHENDIELARVLDPHVQFLALRYPMFSLHYFGFPKTKPTTASPYLKEKYEQEQKEYEQKYQNTLKFLASDTAILLPYMSTSFMASLWTDMRESEQLRELFTNPAFAISPISLHTVAGASTRPLAQPLAAYAGQEQEGACAAIASAIEAELRLLLPQEYMQQALLAPLTTFFFKEEKCEAKTSMKRPWWTRWFQPGD